MFRVEDISEGVYQIRVPRIRVVPVAQSSLAEGVSSSSLSVVPAEEELDEEKKVLRREIKKWWEAVADYVDSLVGYLLPHSALD